MPAQLRACIRRAYDIIGSSTPLPADCGKLCGAACCRGNEYGMLLFPGEAAMLSTVPGFRVERIAYMDGKAWLLMCRGACERRMRPLSCRIFPLAPHFAPNGAVEAIPDPRARRLCPLVDGEYLDVRFRRTVHRAFVYLAGHPQQSAFMHMLSRELNELNRFYK